MRQQMMVIQRKLVIACSTDMPILYGGMGT